MKGSTISPTTLDQMITDDRSQILKAAVPYLPKRNQPFFSILAKTMELSNVITLFSNHSYDMQIQSVPSESSTLDVLNEIGEHCSGAFRDRIGQITRMFSMLELIQTLNIDEPDSDTISKQQN